MIDIRDLRDKPERLCDSERDTGSENLVQASGDVGMSKPVAVDLFAGTGGLGLGFTQAGFHVAAAVELDPKSAESHRRNFPQTALLERDICSISGDDLLCMAGLKPGSVSVLIGGPPCQGFSVIGKREALDPRNSLILEFSRLLLEIRPTAFVLENVAGLLFPRNAPILQELISRIEKGGYRLTSELRPIDAAEFGVPQRRRRVFLVGVDATASGQTQNQLSFSPARGRAVTVWDAIADLSLLEHEPSLDWSDSYVGGLGEPSSAYQEQMRLQHPVAIQRPKEPLLTGCRRTQHGRHSQERFANTEPGAVEPVSRYYRLSESGVSSTLRAGTDKTRGSFTAARPIHPRFPRTITVREAARLHSFPDWMVFDATTWHGMRQIGNAVPPQLAKCVGLAVKDLL